MFNQILLVGNLGNDPEMSYTPTGTPRTTFNVATNEVYNDQQGRRQEKTVWFRVTVWGKDAENCAAYLAKGKSVLVVGRMDAPYAWNDQRDGQAHASLQVTGRTVRFLSKREAEAMAAAEQPESVNYAELNAPY